MLTHSFLKRLLKISLLLAALGALSLAFFLAFLRLQHNSSVTLPAPTGPFLVGRTTYFWLDPTHNDPLAPPNTARELLVWLWYPAALSPSSVSADYLPALWRHALEASTGTLISKFLTRDLSQVHAHSLSAPGLSPRLPAYPVVLFRPGLSALTTDYTTLAEDLASHGYVVVGFDAPYRTFVVVLPTGRVVLRSPANNPETLPEDQQAALATKLVTAWTEDARFVVDQLERLNASPASNPFAGHLDLHALGFFGHSLGGATAAQFCHDDARCHAGMDMDGAPFGTVVQQGLHEPFMFLMSDHSNESDPAAPKILADLDSIYSRLPAGSRFFLTIRGSRHFNFSDQALLKERHLARIIGMLGPIDGRRFFSITTACVHTFFDVYLKHSSSAQLDNLSSAFPEVQLRPR